MANYKLFVYELSPYLAYISAFSILLVFSRLLIFLYFGVFSVDFGFYCSVAIHIRIHYNFSPFFLSVGQGAPYGGQWSSYDVTMSSGPPSATFPPRLRPLVTPLVASIIYLYTTT